jgi:hypothetical protein
MTYTERRPADQRFFDLIQHDEQSGCWRWRGNRSRNGYGRFHFQGSDRSAHRWAYERFVGPIPEDRQLDHTCHTADPTCPGGPGCLHRRCVNPAHLEPVTGLENTRRGTGHGKETRCPKGHPYSPENTYFMRWPSCPRGARFCKACMADRERQYRARKGQRQKEAVPA